jgi:magnesium transporter
MLTVRRATAQGLEEIGRDAVRDHLQRGGGNVWFHCDAPNEEELGFLQGLLHIHPLTREDIVHQNQRPKIHSFDDYVYLAIHPLKRKDKWKVEPSELDILLGHGWVLSVHYGPLTGIIEKAHLHERIASALARGADFLVYTLADLLVDDYFPILDKMEDEIDSLEDRLLGRPRAKSVNELLALKRSLVHVRRAVAPQREVFNQFTRHDFPFVRPDNLVYFRDVYDHLLRIIEEVDTLRELLSGALEIYLAAISNQLNVTMKRLTAWGTIFIVIAAIAGIYGMNFKYMPELEWRYGYYAVLALMALISVILYFYFKRKDYI